MEPGAPGPLRHIETLPVPTMNHIISSGDWVLTPETISTALYDKFFCISATRRTSYPLRSLGSRGGLSVHLGALSPAETSFSAGPTASRMKWVPGTQMPLLFDFCQRGKRSPLSTPASEFLHLPWWSQSTMSLPLPRPRHWTLPGNILSCQRLRGSCGHLVASGQGSTEVLQSAGPFPQSWALQSCRSLLIPEGLTAGCGLQRVASLVLLETQMLARPTYAERSYGHSHGVMREDARLSLPPAVWPS